MSVRRAFISSTSEDLTAYRAAARDAVASAEMLPTMMEYFAASGAQPPLAECLKKVSETDVLLVIVAFRYGWVPPDQTDQPPKNITWLECEQAVADGKEVLAFLADEKHAWPEDLREEYRLALAARDGQATPELLAEVQQNIEGLKKLKEWLNERGVRATFSSPEDLGRQVTLALNQWRQRHAAPLSTTVASDAVPPADATRYLHQLLSETSHIDIRGLQVGTGQAYRFGIEELFISLTTTMAPAAADSRAAVHAADDAVAREMDRQSRDAPLHEALSQSPLVIIGDPGAGKTTFLRRVTHALCQTRLGEVLNAAEARLGITDATFPIFVRLSELGDHIATCRGTADAPKALKAIVPIFGWHTVCLRELESCLFYATSRCLSRHWMS